MLRFSRLPSSRGGVGPFAAAGAPSAGVNEVQTITISGSPTGGTFRLKFRGALTGAIPYNESSANVQVALRALSTIGSDGVTVSGSAGGPYTVTFVGAHAHEAVELIALHLNSLTGGTNPTVAIVEATAGVDATARGAAVGALYVDTTNGDTYQNTGTGPSPLWSLVSGVRIAKVALGALDTGGGVLSWQNPEAGAIAIMRLFVDATTKSTGASTVDFGTTATNGTTSSDTLMDGLDLGTAAGLFENLLNPGTNGKASQRLAAGKWVTGSRASGACAGLVGSAYIQYMRL